MMRAAGTLVRIRAAFVAARRDSVNTVLVDRQVEGTWTVGPRGVVVEPFGGHSRPFPWRGEPGAVSAGGLRELSGAPTTPPTGDDRGTDDRR